MDASSLARACGNAMWSKDATSRTLGLELIAVGAGQAVLAMTVSETMVNWHNSCHGGFIYLLADTAFGYASNSRNERMVAKHCSITYLHTVKRGEQLTAYAAERQRAERAGIYDMSVKRDDGMVIAEFRGNARAIEGTLLPRAEAAQ